MKTAKIFNIRFNMKNNNLERTVIFCDCGGAEHQLLIIKDDDFPSGHREIIIEPHLINYHNFFKRLWIGLKYAFGYKCKYGHWDSIVVSTDNYQPLKDAVNFLENGQKNV